MVDGDLADNVVPESPKTTGETYAVDGERCCLRGTLGEHPKRVERARDPMACQIGDRVEKNEGERKKEVKIP